MERPTIEQLASGDALHREPPPNPSREEVIAWLDGLWRHRRRARLEFLELTTGEWERAHREASERASSSPEFSRELAEEAAAQAKRWLDRHMAEIESLKVDVPPPVDEVLAYAFVDTYRVD